MEARVLQLEATVSAAHELADPGNHGVVSSEPNGITITSSPQSLAKEAGTFASETSGQLRGRLANERDDDAGVATKKQTGHVKVVDKMPPKRSCGLTESICIDEKTRYLTYIPGGGFNNQRQSLERAFQIAHLTQRTLVLRDIYVDPKHNPKSLTAGSFLPVDQFFDVGHMSSFGVAVMKYQEFKRQEPALSISPTVMKGIFAHSEIWTDSIPCNYSVNPVLDIQGNPLPVDKLFPIIESLSCLTDPFLEIGLIGMNRYWRTNRDTREKALEAVRFAPAIRALAFDAIVELGGREKFSCVHFRQGDKLTVSPKEYNYTAEEVAVAMTKFVQPQETVYIATDASQSDIQPFVDRLKEHRVQSFFSMSSLQTEDYNSNDYVGCVEVEICSSARLFFASSSTLSASILNQRHGVSGITQWEIDQTTNFVIKKIVK